ncbi:MAG: carboxypeptidase M32 [Chloroflexota bacterium]
MDEKLTALKTRLLEVDDLKSAAALLGWDQTTYMPSGGASSRGRQLATLGRLAQEKFVDPEMGKLLQDLAKYEASLPYDSDEASLIRVTRRDYERATNVPPALLAELTTHSSLSYQTWIKAREADDFEAMIPYFEKTLELSRQMADCFPGYEHIADPLIEETDSGMTVAQIKPLFAELRNQLVPLVQAIQASDPVDATCLYQNFPGQTQLDFGLAAIKAFGYDFERGRSDLTHHPYMTKFGLGDVRITTRYDDNHLGDGIFATMHESGHAMYEQGIAMAYDGMPIGNGTSSGVHESQSRLWENIIGRSKRYWQGQYTVLQETFPAQLKEVSLEQFYQAINKVEPTLIRVQADEVTYNLHIMLRFDLEVALLEGSLRVQDLPDAWRERYKSDLGITPPDHKDGVLQDVHWTFGIGGMFQGYTLGNVLAAQYYEAALKAHPEIPEEIEQGQFQTLHGWLQTNIYQHGRKYAAPELTKRVTGMDLSLSPYIQYLNDKYGDIYGLS